MKDGIHNLNTHDTEVLAEWFMWKLSMEQRHNLIAEMPLIYSRMFPDVSPTLMGDYVKTRINRERSGE